MTDYSNGFDAGFATALRHSDRHHHAFGAVTENEATKKISIGFRPEQFSFVMGICRELDCSFAAAVREIVDRARASTVSRPNGETP